MDKIRTAVVGTGKMGEIHARVYSQLPQSQLVALVDVDHNKAKRLARKYRCETALDVADLIGNDVVLDMADGIYETLQEHRYIAPNLLRRMVAAGWLGQKTKKGFYDYNK